MDIPKNISFPRLEALIREQYRKELPLDTYKRYSAGRWPQVLRLIGSRRDLAEALCADARDAALIDPADIAA
jgi:hypothetical protein